MALKEKHGDVLQWLLKLRNMEIHHMNSEMQDDLWQWHSNLNGKIKLEDIQANMMDLQQSLDMVYGALISIFCLLPKSLSNEVRGSESPKSIRRTGS